MITLNTCSPHGVAAIPLLSIKEALDSSTFRSQKEYVSTITPTLDV